MNRFLLNETETNNLLRIQTSRFDANDGDDEGDDFERQELLESMPDDLGCDFFLNPNDLFRK